MIWLAWRQHRAMLAAFLLIFGAVAAFYLIDAVRIQAAFDAGGLAECVGKLGSEQCAGRGNQFINFDVGWPQLLGPLLAVGSGAIGIFLGAPLVASEFERGTHQWVWSQGISRTRWLAVKYLLLALAAAVLAAGTGAAFTRWNRPVAELTGPFTRFGSFDNTPLMLAVYTVFALAVGIAVSAFLRRTVVAMGVTLLVFLLLRVGITYGVRPHYMAPVTVSSDVSDGGYALGMDPRDWDWRSKWVDKAGNTVSQDTIHRLTNPAFNPAAAGKSYGQVLQQRGIHYVDLVQPYQRAGTFHLVEAGLYGVLIAVCAGFAFWRIRRRAI